LSYIGKFAEAIPDYDNYLLQEPDDNKGFIWRGIAKFRIDNFEGAMADFDNSINMVQTDYEAYYWKGLTYLEIKDFQSALSYLNIAADNKPTTDLYYWRGWTNQNLNRKDAAIADYTRSIQSNVNTGFSLVNRSQIYVDKGEYVKAFDDLIKAQSINHPLDRDNFYRIKELAGK